MREFGLIGKPLGHSFSPKYFAQKFKSEGIMDAVYNAFPLDSIQELPDLIANHPNLCGLNVTIPYKSEVISFLDELSPEAAESGAVNTIKFIRKDSKLILKGFNTDIPAFSSVLAPHLSAYHHTALILGSGGASKAVAYALNKMGIDYYFVTRSKTDLEKKLIHYTDLKPEHIKSIKLIVNTSPVGQFPNVDEAPNIDYNQIDHLHILFDLIYNPAATKFLTFGEEVGATTINGYKMLELQAEAAWKIWNT